MAAHRSPKRPAADGGPGPDSGPDRGPDRHAALALYRRRAPVYDLELALFEPLRAEAIARLAPRPGDTVLDVACGTGLSFAGLRRAVGPRGRVIGLEQSPEMVAQARRRIARARWRNVDLLCAPAEAAPLSGQADAALFHLSHDVLQHADAVAHLMRHLKPGAPVVACGLKWAGGLMRPANLLVWVAARHSVTDFASLGAPWRLLAPHLDGLTVGDRWLGAVYLAHGRRR